MTPIDLVSIDARIARAYASVTRTLTRLRDAKTEADVQAVPEPFGELRDVAGQTLYRSLEEQADAFAFAEDHRRALLRWVHELTQTRIGWDLTLADAEALHKPDPALPPHLLADVDFETTYADAFDSLVQAVDAPRIAKALDRMTELAAPVAGVRKERRARRFEVSHRLALAHPWALVAREIDAAKLIAHANAVLDATEPLAIELHKSRRRDAFPVARAFEDAFARDAREGWPAHLNARWFEEVFRAIAPRFPEDVRFPEPIAGASFLRGAMGWGFALRQRGIARSLPFALSRDPYPIEAFALGGALAIAVSDRVFAKRKLELPVRASDAHARTLARVLFADLRRTAASVINGEVETPREDALEEMGARIFGTPLPKALALVWSNGGFSRGDDMAPARLLGAFRSYELTRHLIDRFDEDWFDNPKAGAHIASISAGPVWSMETFDSDRTNGVIKAIVKSFEELLG